MKYNYCQLWLTCANRSEADEIANALLVKHMVACVRQLPVESKFHWKGKIEESKEILLLMESKIALFEQIEAEVAKHHSYNTFVLEAVPVEKISTKAKDWIEEVTNV